MEPDWDTVDMQLFADTVWTVQTSGSGSPRPPPVAALNNVTNPLLPNSIFRLIDNHSCTQAQTRTPADFRAQYLPAGHRLLPEKPPGEKGEQLRYTLIIGEPNLTGDDGDSGSRNLHGSKAPVRVCAHACVRV